MGIFNIFRKDDKNKQKSGAQKRGAKSLPAGLSAARHDRRANVKKEPDAVSDGEDLNKIAGEKEIVAEAKRSSRGTEIKPRITEKTSREEAAGKYTFEVSEGSSKPEVKKAVEEIYKTKVASVNLMNVEAKQLGRMRRGYGTRGCFRKAIVTLKPGEKINLS